MKPFGFTVSVLKDTNRVVASSEVNFAKVEPGNYFKISGEPLFYIVARADKFFYIKDFQVLDAKTITIPSEIGVNLLPGDILKITYKEYELNNLYEIKSGGIRYRVNDVVTVDGGVATANRESGFIESTSFTVLEVDENGSILSLGPRTKGRYLQTPEGVSPIIGGHGVSAVIEADYKLMESRATIESSIANIPDANGNKIVLQFPLPENLKQGKLSVEKWQLTLTSNYLGDNKINAKYDITNSFTPQLRLPLLVQNSFQKDILYNQAMNMLEKEISELKTRLEKLEKSSS